MNSKQSVLLYGADVWADALGKKEYSKRLGQVQRREVLRVASAYRTVSESTVVVIAGVILVALFDKDRKAIYKRKRKEGWLLAKTGNVHLVSGKPLGEMRLEPDGLRGSLVT